MTSKKAPEPELLEQEAKVIELRRSGATWSVIAERVGYAGPSGAYKAYQRAAERMIRPNLEELRDTELDRLDRLQLGLWGKAIQGDVRAVDSVLRIIDRRARLLGLDAPSQVNLKAEVNTYDANSIDSEVARLIQILDSGAARELDAATGSAGTDTN